MTAMLRFLSLYFHWYARFTGTDSTNTLIEDCEERRTTIAKLLRSNNVQRQAVQKELMDYEDGKDDTYWFALRVSQRGDQRNAVADLYLDVLDVAF